MTRAEQTRQAVASVGTITNQGNPKRIEFMADRPTTTDVLYDSMESPMGDGFRLIHIKGNHFAAVDGR